VIQRPPGMGAFQFVVLATLRAAQLMRGCIPRVDGIHKSTVVAQMEVSAGKVTEASVAPVSSEAPGEGQPLVTVP
jgi:DNA-directed RNA polymerase subunit K/omega